LFVLLGTECGFAMRYKVVEGGGEDENQ